MDIQHPDIEILLAIYCPNRRWLKELLVSLDSQTYVGRLKVSICDDATPAEVSKGCLNSDQIEPFISKYLKKIPFSYSKNVKNIGSNATFSELSRNATYPYIAYCDQDDVWDVDKLARSMDCLLSCKAGMVFGDARVIDSQNNILADSLETAWKGFSLPKCEQPLSGYKVLERLLCKNFVVGCTIVAARSVVEMAIPFSTDMVHDQWIAIHAVRQTRIAAVKGTLLSYRIHGKNQTGKLAGIYSKKDYYNKRVRPYRRSMHEIVRRTKSRQWGINDALTWGCARELYWNGDIRAINLMLRLGSTKGRRPVTFFELVAAPLPEVLFRLLLTFIKR